jgi:hypothetical protein
MPEVVRLQRLFLQEDLPKDSEDVESWTQAYLIHESINSIIEERMLQLRYTNGEEEEVS